MNAKFVELQRICNQQWQGENYYWNTERTVSDWKIPKKIEQNWN